MSSVSKLTIEFPPLASSVLFGGRNRATTTHDRVSAILNDLHCSKLPTFDSVARRTPKDKLLAVLVARLSSLY